jgi:hypothetical protein
MAHKKIKSISDLVKHLKSDVDIKNKPVWFRGHSDESWTLEPSYDRLKTPPIETDLVNKFRQNANYLISAQVPSSDFQWLFLMQHYGVPTRLLDWTESPLVALYFSLETENKKTLKKDGALWLLYPGKLNENTNKDQEGYIPAFEDKEHMETYSTEKYVKGLDQGVLPKAAIATRNNPRIQAQLGVFTISHHKKTPIEDIGDKKHVIKYIIPKECKKDLAEEISLIGIDKFQIFPELSVIGEIIKGGVK